MAFRQPQEQEQGVPSLGYRLSSNRQPGIEQSNNMMPQEGMRPRFNPRDMPMPPQDMPMPEYFKPIGRPGMGNYQQMGQTNMDDARREAYAYNTSDRNPTTMDPIMAFATNPQVRRDFMDKYELEQQMDPDNFFTNRMDIGEQFNVNPFGDIDYPQMSIEFGEEEAAVDPSDYRTIMKMIEAGLNPDDYMAANRGGIASLRR